MKQEQKIRFTQGIILSLLIGLIPILRTESTLDPNLTIQFIGLGVLLLVIWFVYQKQLTDFVLIWNGSTFFLTACVVFLAYSIISAGISNNLSDAIFSLSKYTVFVLLMIAIQIYKNTDFVFRTIAITASVLGIIILIPGYYQLIGLISEKVLIIPLGTYSIYSIFPHRNLFSEILLFTIPFSAFLYFTEKKFWRYFSLGSYSLAFLMIIILSNRASWLAIILIGAAALFLFLINKKQILSTRSIAIFIANTAIVILAAILFFSVYSNSDSLKTHALSSIDVKQGSSKDRMELWSRTMKLISEKPVLGSGLGSWKIDILKFGNAGLVSEDNTTFYTRPHNDFLWIAAEQGIIGLCLYAALFLIIFFLLFRLLLKETEKLLFSKLLVILSITIGYLVFSMFSFPKERISHNIFLFSSWAVFLCILNTKSKRDSARILNFKPVYYCSIPVLLLLLFIGIERMKGEVHTKLAIYYKSTSRFQRCINEINQADSYFYRIDETSTPLAWYAGLSYFKLNDYSKASEYLERAFSINPYHIYVLNDYAGSLVKTNKSDSALQYYLKAIKIAPNYLDARLNICALYFGKGKYSDALNILKTTDISNSSERYIKTVTLVIKKLIEANLNATQPSEAFMHLYKVENSRFDFFRNILAEFQKSELPSDEFVRKYINGYAVK